MVVWIVVVVLSHFLTLQIIAIWSGTHGSGGGCSSRLGSNWDGFESWSFGYEYVVVDWLMVDVDLHLPFDFWVLWARLPGAAAKAHANLDAHSSVDRFYVLIRICRQVRGFHWMIRLWIGMRQDGLHRSRMLSKVGEARVSMLVDGGEWNGEIESKITLICAFYWLSRNGFIHREMISMYFANSTHFEPGLYFPRVPWCNNNSHFQDFPTAAALLKSLLSRSPDDVYILSGIGRLLLKVGVLLLFVDFHICRLQQSVGWHQGRGKVF